MSVEVADTRLDDDITRSVAASLNGAERYERPYRNWRLKQLFPEAVARELAALPFAAADLHGVSGRRELHNEDRRYFAGEVLEQHPVARSVAEAFQSPAMVAAFARHTGAKLDGTYLRIEYCVDVDGFWLEPHTDLGVKSLTLLTQLPAAGQEDLGTDIYSGPDAWCERCAFEWNGAMLFVPANDTWHGFEPRTIPGPRRSVIVNYVTEDWRAREQLAFDGRPVRAG